MVCCLRLAAAPSLETLEAPTFKDSYHESSRLRMEGIKMERPSGPPLGAATQSTGRPMAENGVPRPSLQSTIRRVPNPTVRKATSNSALSSQIPRSEGQVIALAREAMKTAIEENRNKATETIGVSNELKPGVTIDLSHKQIQRFPEEVVDIIKNELERYLYPSHLSQRDPADSLI